jgi:transcriptional regulator EpsA
MRSENLAALRPELPASAQTSETENADPAALDVVQLISLKENLDASLRVYARPHFFSWTQGRLQSLVRHDVLVCARRNGTPLSLRVDSFATVVPDCTIFSETFLQDASVALKLIKAWQKRRFRPVICEAGDRALLGRGAFTRELERIGATQLVAHGTHDANGDVESFFTLACRPGTVGPRQAYLLQMAVPFLHSAWVRTQLNGAAESDHLERAGKSVLTPREQQILRWIYLGKTNGEVGAILSLSALTVKNHVHKILHKLNVFNRTQAVAKALDTRILSPCTLESDTAANAGEVDPMVAESRRRRARFALQSDLRRDRPRGPVRNRQAGPVHSISSALHSPQHQSRVTKVLPVAGVKGPQ